MFYFIILVIEETVGVAGKWVEGIGEKRRDEWVWDSLERFFLFGCDFE